MTTQVLHPRFDATRSALSEAGDRFAGLVSDTQSPRVRATEKWSVAETAAHVCAIAHSYTAMLRDASVPGIDYLVPKRRWTPFTT